MNRTILLTCLASALALALQSCNTVEGFGKDLQKVGGKMESEAGAVQDGAYDDPQ